MTYAQVLALIQQFIVANGNNEITANVLRPILEDILTQPNEKMGDLIDLQTTDQSSLVAAINEALSLITPTIGSYNTKIHYLSLNGVDTDLPELTKIAEAVKIHGPFTCDAGQQMVFRTVSIVGAQVNGIVVSRYYRLLRNITTIGGTIIQQQVLPSWFMQDGISEYSNPETTGSIVELGDIGTDNVWDVFNLGNNGVAWDMNDYRFVRATQNSEIMFWAFTGQERYYGGSDMNVEPDIFEAFENDFFLITDQPPAPDPGYGPIETEDTADIILTGDGTEATPLEAELTQVIKDEIAKGVEAHDYTLDDVVQNGNETTESIILSSEEHPSESVEIGVKESSPGVAYGAIEIFSEDGYGAFSGSNLGFSRGGKTAVFHPSGLFSLFNDGKSLSINFPTDNPMPLAPTLSTWFVLSVNGRYPNEKGEIHLPENQQTRITSSGLLLSSYNNHTVFFDGTNLTIDVDMNISELPPRAEVYFYNLGDSDVEFNFIVAPGWSLPDDATLEPNGTCILMRVLNEQKLILIGNE